MVLVDFLLCGRHEFGVIYVNHKSEYADQAQSFVSDYCFQRGIEFQTKTIDGERNPKKSMEEWWRDKRYEVLNEFEGTKASAHHLNDVAETYVFSALSGNPKLIPWIRDDMIRPLLSTPKSGIIDWASEHDVDHIDDPSNNNMRFARNKIRHKIIPNCLEVNPGFLSVIRKRILKTCPV